MAVSSQGGVCHFSFVLSGLAGVGKTAIFNCLKQMTGAEVVDNTSSSDGGIDCCIYSTVVRGIKCKVGNTIVKMSDKEECLVSLCAYFKAVSGTGCLILINLDQPTTSV